MSTLPKRWLPLSRKSPSPSWTMLRKWQKWTRSWNSRKIATSSAFGSPPSDPVQSARPTRFYRQCRAISRMSAADENIRGSPKIGCGGSSGWIARNMSFSSRVGVIALRKPYMFARSVDSEMPS